MTVIRILLQCLIVILGGGIVFLALSSPNPNFDIAAAVFFLTVFLLALTKVLKEHARQRSEFAYQFSFKPLGVALFMLGAFSFYVAIRYLIGSESLPDGEGSCRAVCGLVMLAEFSLGATAARVVGFAAWGAIGLFLGSLGYRMWRDR